jgi:hypothetical protein
MEDRPRQRSSRKSLYHLTSGHSERLFYISFIHTFNVRQVDGGQLGIRQTVGDGGGGDGITSLATLLFCDTYFVCVFSSSYSSSSTRAGGWSSGWSAVAVWWRDTPVEKDLLTDDPDRGDTRIVPQQQRFQTGSAAPTPRRRRPVRTEQRTATTTPPSAERPPKATAARPSISFGTGSSVGCCCLPITLSSLLMHVAFSNHKHTPADRRRGGEAATATGGFRFFGRRHVVALFLLLSIFGWAPFFIHSYLVDGPARKNGRYLRHF